MVSYCFAVPHFIFSSILIGGTVGTLSGRQNEMLALLEIGIAGVATLLCGWYAAPAVRSRRTHSLFQTVTSSTGWPALLLIASITAMALSRHVWPSLPALAPWHIADLLAGLAPALLIAAVLTMPRTRTSTLSPTRFIVDGLLIMVAAETVMWFFFLGPAVNRMTQHVPEYPLHGLLQPGVALPLLDLLLVGGLLVLSSRSTGLARPILAPLVAGLGLTILADSLHYYESLFGSNFSPLIPGILQIIASLMLAMAAVHLVRARASGHEGELALPEMGSQRGGAFDMAPHVWDSLMPYALVPAAVGLSLYAWTKAFPAGVTQGVVAGTVVLVGLAFVRQILAIQENLRLYREVNSAYLRSVASAERTHMLNEELHTTQEALQVNNEALAHANLKLQAQATTDPLTGLPNHRAMVLAIDQELERAHRYGRPCSLLFLDLDHFKALNDSCGHLAGDTVLRDLVNPIVSGLRNIDIAGRWGGEEFIVILPETTLDEALIAAERIREAVTCWQFSAGMLGAPQPSGWARLHLLDRRGHLSRQCRNARRFDRRG